MKYLFIIWLLVLSLVAPSAAIAQAKQPYSLISGLGTLHHQVSTPDPQAQQFFDQGLSFIYAFNHDEAVRSFEYAAKLDPHLAMAYWGIALALGPNINLDVDPDRERVCLPSNTASFSIVHSSICPRTGIYYRLGKALLPRISCRLVSTSGGLCQGNGKPSQALSR